MGQTHLWPAYESNWDVRRPRLVRWIHLLPSLCESSVIVQGIQHLTFLCMTRVVETHTHCRFDLRRSQGREKLRNDTNQRGIYAEIDPRKPV
jgi:hypothetical protein